MLIHLALKNFVIVKQLDLDIENGLTVLTGETGAGKSILLDALQFILGARADSGVIREGCDNSDLCAIFSCNDAAQTFLIEAGLNDEDQRQVIIRRVIEKNGRSRAWINGVVATLTQLKALGATLLDIHGQHAQQSLLTASGQRELLDAFGNYPEALSNVFYAYRAWHQAHLELDQAKENAQKLADEAERLAWINEELSQIEPVPGEWESINAEHRRLGNASEIIEGVRQSVQMLDSGRDSIVSMLGAQAAALEQLSRYDEKLAHLSAQLFEAQAICEDCLRELEHYLDRTDLDEAHFEKIDQRVTQYFNAARKFHVLPEALHEKYTQTQERLQALSQSLDLDRLSRLEQEALHNYHVAAAQLTEKRRQAAQNLSERVTESMQSLAMNGGHFVIELKPESTPTPKGSEHCEFLVAGHAGVMARSLGKVASGGELSRISLAIAVITAQATPVNTLIFDEVDAGIGGAVAQTVGQLLQSLAAQRQVLCVTHLPQVASYADHHCLVQKQLIEKTTVSRLSVLNESERIREIARMLSGQCITDSSVKTAEEMIYSASRTH